MQNQIIKEIGLDYKAVQHHLKILEKNNLITKDEKVYGTKYSISSLLENDITIYDEIASKLKIQKSFP